VSSTFSRMENDNSLQHPIQDEMDDLTQDFARCYTAVERETRQDTIYREAALYGRASRQAMPTEEQDLGDQYDHFDDRVLDKPSQFSGSQRHRPRHSIGIPSQSSEAVGGEFDFQVPPTEARRNITTRRSRGRSAELSKDPAVLMTKRNKSRAKDVEYRRVSVGGQPTRVVGASLPGHEILQRCKARVSAEMKHRADLRIASLHEQSRATRMSARASEPRPASSASARMPDRMSAPRHASSSKAQGVQGAHLKDGTIRPSSSMMSTPVPKAEAHKGPFLARHIPEHQVAPQIHDELIALLAIRQRYQEDMEEAVQDGDDAVLFLNQQRYDECNARMHGVYERYFNTKNEGMGSSTVSGHESSFDDRLRQPAAQGFSGPPISAQRVSTSSSPHFVTVDELPKSYSPQHISRTSSSVQSPPSGSFEIFFLYWDEDITMTVWNTMPLSNLFTFAWQWLLQEFGFDGLVEDIDLVIRSERGDETYLQHTGCIQDVPIHANEEIAIETVELVPHMLHRPSSHSASRQPQPRRTMRPVAASYAPEPLVLADDRIDSKSYDKIRQTFKCPKFVGHAKDWKLWNKGLMRFLAIWDLDYVLDPDFMTVLPLSKDKFRDNKLVYYLIEDAVQGSLLASSYVHKAPLYNGFEAYYTLLDGFVFAGSTTASLLLNELTNFRFLKDETPTAMVLRLEELFQDLRLLPGDASMVFNDTQCIGYLLGALRHEPAWATVHSYIQSGQIQGDMTFSKACDELRVRCEAARAHEVMDRPVGHKVRTLVAQPTSDQSDSLTAEKVFAYISTMAMKHSSENAKPTEKGTKGRKGKARTLYPCLAKDCTEETYFPLCGNHYHSLVAAKLSSVELRQQYGNATYNAETKMVVYPDKIPAERKPSNVKRVRAAAAATMSAS
jgi:hypothetical protein